MINKDRKPKTSRIKTDNIEFKRESKVAYACVKGRILIGELVYEEIPRSGNVEEKVKFIIPEELEPVYKSSIVAYLNLEECIEKNRIRYDRLVRKGDSAFEYLKVLEDEQKKYR